MLSAAETKCTNANHIPLLIPHRMSSQFAGYMVKNPKIMPICIMNQKTRLSGLGCQASAIQGEHADLERDERQRIRLHSIDEGLSPRDMPHSPDRKILEGNAERVGENELRNVFGKQDGSEQHQSEAEDDRWTQAAN